MKLAILPLLFLLTTAPAQPANDIKRVALEQEFDIKVGESVLVEQTGLKISFTAVEEDSRCPVDVKCVWAGNGKINLRLSKTGKRAADIKLNTGLDPKHELFASYDVKLAGLNPRRKSNEKIKIGDYVATVVVTRK